jgi:hypothetical protein
MSRCLKSNFAGKRVPFERCALTGQHSISSGNVFVFIKIYYISLRASPPPCRNKMDMTKHKQTCHNFSSSIMNLFSGMHQCQFNVTTVNPTRCSSTISDVLGSHETRTNLVPHMHVSWTDSHTFLLPFRAISDSYCDICFVLRKSFVTQDLVVNAS